MVSGTATDWMNVDVPLGLDDAALRSYFGVPPSPEDELAKNIDEKRKRWHKRSNGPGGVERSRRVKEIIKALEAHLIRGQDLPEGILEGEVRTDYSAPLPPPVFEALDEWLSLIETLLTRGKNDRALETAHQGLERWPDDPRATNAFCSTVAFLASTDQLSDAAMISEALVLSQKCPDLLPQDSSAWYKRCVLLAASDRAAEIAGLESEVAARLGSVPSDILVLIGQALITAGKLDDGLSRLVRAVAESPDDFGVRSEATDAAINAARRLLPLASAEAVTAYQEIIDVGAWCAAGVPAAEEIIRSHRMWATRCSKKAFVGSWQLRTFLSVLTVFIWLPIHNAARSKPLWKIFVEGPEQSGDEFFLVSGADYVREVHGSVAMPWAAPGAAWPKIEDYAIKGE